MAELFAGRYLLVDVLGTGGAGTVWRAWDRKRGRYLAAKVLQQRDAAALLRFVREQSLRIEHSHVLAPNGWAAEDDQVLFTMELMRGGSVADLLGDYGALPVDVAGVLLAQLANGLAAVHAAGVVHRDLKPANLLLEPTGRGQPHLRLSDFGIAVVLGEPRLTQQQYLVGTPGYFAPEQLRGAAPDPRQDLYGLGVVGCQLLSGQPPPADPWQATVVPPPGLPASVDAVLRRLLAENPADRYPTAEQAAAAVVEAFDGCGPRAGDPGEPVEVFDHLQPLPAGFDGTGPLATEAGGEDAATVTAPAPATAPASAAASAPASAPAGTLGPTVIGPLPTAPPAKAPTPLKPAKQPRQPVLARLRRNPAGPPPRRPGGKSAGTRPVRILWAAIAAGVVAVLLAVAAVLVTFGPWSAAEPGQQCDFAKVGSRAAGPDGTVFVCTQGSDGYQWQRA